MSPPDALLLGDGTDLCRDASPFPWERPAADR